MHTRTPPLKIWLYAFLIAVSLMLAAAGYSYFMLDDLWSILA